MENLTIRKIKEILKQRKIDDYIYQRLVQLATFGNFEAMDLLNDL